MSPLNKAECCKQRAKSIWSQSSGPIRSNLLPRQNSSFLPRHTAPPTGPAGSSRCSGCSCLSVGSHDLWWPGLAWQPCVVAPPPAPLDSDPLGRSPPLGLQQPQEAVLAAVGGAHTAHTNRKQSRDGASARWAWPTPPPPLVSFRPAEIFPVPAAGTRCLSSPCD